VFQLLFNKQSIDYLLVATLKGHKYGVKTFDCKAGIIVSLGDENDKGMMVWSLENQALVSANPIQKSVLNDVKVLGDGLNFVTCGSNGHFKHWKLMQLGSMIQGEQTKEKMGQ